MSKKFLNAFCTTELMNLVIALLGSALMRITFSAYLALLHIFHVFLRCTSFITNNISKAQTLLRPLFLERRFSSSFYISRLPDHKWIFWIDLPNKEAEASLPRSLEKPQKWPKRRVFLILLLVRIICFSNTTVLMVECMKIVSI